MSSGPQLVFRTTSFRYPLPSPSINGSTTPSLSATDADNLFCPDRPPETPHIGESFTLGTRKSNLAHIQTHLVASELASLHPSSEFSVESMTTVGDRNQITPLHLLTPYSQQQPAKSLWTDELEARLTSGHFDLLVHSLKDVPTTLKDGCEIGCMLRREDPRDCWVVKKGETWGSLEELPEGSVVGTGSVRRVAQLKRRFPGLRFEDMRGNLFVPIDSYGLVLMGRRNTRLTKLDSPTSIYAGLILATSGLTRLGSAGRITCTLESPSLYHAVGQGALGVEIRSGDSRVREVMRGLGHWQTEWRCGAERGCLRVLEGGCSVPVGVETELEELDEEAELGLDPDDFEPLLPDSPMLWFSGILDRSLPLPTTSTSSPPLTPRRARLTLRTCVTSLDGTSQVVHSPPGTIVGSYQQAERWGEMCALAMKEQGGKEILDEVGRIRRERERRDLERAIERSRAEAKSRPALRHGPRGSILRQSFRPRPVDGVEEEEQEEEEEGDEVGAGGMQAHRGLDGLVSSLTGMRVEERNGHEEGAGAS